MNAVELMRELGNRQIQVTTDGETLRCASPPGALTPDLKNALAEHKTALIAALTYRHGEDPPAILPRSRGGAIPLSYAQQRLWFLHQVAREDSSYNIAAVFRLVGDFDVDVFRDCLREIVRRHEILRTRIVYRDGAAAQEVSPNVEVEAPLVDLSALPGGRGEEEARRRVEAQAREPFDLGAVPLLRALLLDLGRRGALREREHVVAITLHHIVSDGWSTGVLIREFSELYEAFAAGRASPLPALELQYGDYAVWQRDWLQGEVLERQLAYWREALSGAPATLDLMTDYPRPATRDPRGAVYDFAVPASVTTKLRDLGRGCGATLFMTLLGAFAALLFRHSGQTDLCVGTPVANRRRVELEGLIGFFVNTLVMRADLSGDPSFVELLRRVRAQALGAQANQDLPFERLVEELQPERDMSRSPLFQAMFILQNAPSRAPGLAGLRIDAFAMESGTSKFDLTLQASESEDGLLFSLEYATALFDAATIERMARRFQLLLEGIAAAPERRLSELPLLPEDELRRLLVEWNPAAAYAESRCLHELFEAQVARSPNAIAVVFEEARLSYGGLNAQANRLAHHLRRRGVVADDVVGLCVERSLDLVISVLGVLKAGGAYLPLDPSYPQARLAYMIEDARPKLILTQEALCERLPEGVETLRLDADRATLAGESEANPAPAATPQNLAYIIYTSGSTGKPKGVMTPHGAIGRLVKDNRYAAFSPDDRVACVSNPAFDAVTMEIAAPLAVGGCIVVIDQATFLDPVRFGTALNRHAITALFMTTALFTQYFAVLGRAFARLRFLLTGGEVASPDCFAKLLSDGAPQHLIHCYGPTETTTYATTFEVVSIDGRDTRVPIGRPIAQTQIYILDDRMNPVPQGVAGEIFIGGAGLARGYVDRSDLTAERFVPDPFDVAGKRLYRSGDLARYRADGAIEFIGRADHQVKIRGFRIELGEIEAALVRLPQVREALVRVQEDSVSGKRLLAYVTASGDAPLDPAQLRDALRGELPEYMVPASFVALDAMPLTPTGKIDRESLPRPDFTSQATGGYVAPRDVLEWVIAREFQAVLGVDRVGIHDGFFELGGASISGLKLADRIRRTICTALPMSAIFQAQTVAELAKWISNDDNRVGSPLVLMRPGGEAPPLFLVHPAGGSIIRYRELAEAMPPARNIYGCQSRHLFEETDHSSNSGRNGGRLCRAHLRSPAARPISRAWLEHGRRNRHDHGVAARTARGAGRFRRSLGHSFRPRSFQHGRAGSAARHGSGLSEVLRPASKPERRWHYSGRTGRTAQRGRPRPSCDVVGAAVSPGLFHRRRVVGAGAGILERRLGGAHEFPVFGK